jgi:hypothetical protein
MKAEIACNLPSSVSAVQVIDAALPDLVPGFMAWIVRKVQIFLLLASRIGRQMEVKLR